MNTFFIKRRILTYFLFNFRIYNLIYNIFIAFFSCHVNTLVSLENLACKIISKDLISSANFDSSPFTLL